MSRETRGVFVRQTVKDAMAQQSTWTKKGLIDVGGLAIDGADDLEAEEVGQHAVGEIEDGADLLAIIGTTSHESSVGILQDDDELHISITAALLSPEADEVGIGKHAHGRWWDEVKAMRLFEHAHEVAQVGGLAGAGRAFEDGEAVIARANFGDEALVPFPAFSAVVKGVGLFVEDGILSQQDELTTDFATCPDQIKGAGLWFGRFAVALMKAGCQCLGFIGVVGIADDPGFIRIEE